MIKKAIAIIALLIGLGFMLIPYDALLFYKNKRNFAISPEPQGNSMTPYSAKATKGPHKATGSKHPLFVIQKHNASHLHYDFRLEIDGVLKSWAVPKGPSTNPHDKRLAIETEDHPMDYATFEGTIPEGEYGAGTVIIWDTGTFDNIKEKSGKHIPLTDCYENGQIEVTLHGTKLHGNYALIRTEGDAKKWLLIKMHDEYANEQSNIVEKQPESVFSGKTVEEIESKKKTAPMKIKAGRYTVEISNENKILFGRSGITKADLVNYYHAITPIMMSYVKDRPISLQRFPQGITEKGFFQKNASDYFPDWITRVPIAKQDGGTVHYVVIDKPATLIYLANQDCITPHIWLSRIDNLKLPDRLIFDLDPANDLTFSDVQAVAKKLKEKLDDLKLPTFCMLTGSRGAHIVVPLKRVHTFDEVRTFAHTIALQLAQEFPQLITVDTHKEKRDKRVFIDWLRNGFGATTVAPYAVRAHEGAPVAMPVTWEELLSPKMTSQQYTIANALKHIDSVGDVWQSLQKHAVTLKNKTFN